MLSRKQFLAGLPLLTAASAALSPLAAQDAAAQPAGGSAMPAKPPEVSAEIAGFVAGAKWETLSPELIELSKKHILDALGLSLAGEQAETGPLVRRYLTELGLGQGLATVLGTGLRAPPRFAAFANGVAIHADDYDDTQLAAAPDRVYGLLTHPSVTALPPALALAEAKGRSGRDFMLAYHLGAEIEMKLAEASAPRAYETGFHSTGLFGVFGAAISAGKMLNLDAMGLRYALGIAGAESSGLRENFGTMTKPFQAGHAAEGGVQAAELAALGWTAAANVLEAQRGFFFAAAGGFDPSVISGKLGNKWSYLSPGVSIKPYPSGSLSHPAMDEMLRLVRANKFKAADVAQIRVGTNKQMLNTLIHHTPTNGLEAKFSMEYCMAALVVYGKAGLIEFQDAQVNQPEVQALLRKVDFYNSPQADAAGADKMRSYIDITLKDGRKIQGGQMVDFARGSPAFPMSFDDEVEKFRDCAQYAKFSSATADKIIAQVRNLDRLDDIRMLTALLAKPA